MKQLDEENEEFAHKHVGLSLGQSIQQARAAKGWTQKDLAMVRVISLLLSFLFFFFAVKIKTKSHPCTETPRCIILGRRGAPLPELSFFKINCNIWFLPTVLFWLYSPPQRIAEKPQIVTEYETGKAIPNNQIIQKMERALGAKLK